MWLHLTAHLAGTSAHTQPRAGTPRSPSSTSTVPRQCRGRRVPAQTRDSSPCQVLRKRSFGIVQREPQPAGSRGGAGGAEQLSVGTAEQLPWRCCRTWQARSCRGPRLRAAPAPSRSCPCARAASPRPRRAPHAPAGGHGRLVLRGWRRPCPWMRKGFPLRRPEAGARSGAAWHPLSRPHAAPRSSSGSRQHRPPLPAPPPRPPRWPCTAPLAWPRLLATRKEPADFSPRLGPCQAFI